MTEFMLCLNITAWNTLYVRVCVCMCMCAMDKAGQVCDVYSGESLQEQNIDTIPNHGHVFGGHASSVFTPAHF